MGLDPARLGRGPTDEHSVHPHHRDFIVTPISDQIGRIDSVSKTEYYDLKNHFSEPQCKMTVLPLNSGKSRFDPCITDSACKNQLVVVSIQYGPFNPYIPIRSTTIGKSRVAKDPIAMHTSWRSNSDNASVTSIGYPRMSASGESSTTMHPLLHASGSHPIPPPDDPKTNQYNQDLGVIHSTNGNHLESPNEGSSIDHQESRRLDDSYSKVDKIKQLETTILDAFYQQNQAFHRLITGIRQEAHNDTNALSLGLNAVRTETAILSTDQADARISVVNSSYSVISDLSTSEASVFRSWVSTSAISIFRSGYSAISDNQT
ncbi:hypothetical protein F511_03735 [Dorcoceras hygrometricum]|uniref:Uncharacterized protein n=1 Tax=Dorcoceras hygrometricum TaxID=472368 RepID=A0A2Z7B9W4_9LAMI|nr:hypothetical protein F511_03735 [Dorcoceras hygrometricum]